MDATILARVILKYGIVGALAAFLVWHMAAREDRISGEIFDLLRIHATETAHYLYTNCVNTAIIAGTNVELCRPQSQQTR